MKFVIQSYLKTILIITIVFVILGQQSVLAKSGEKDSFTGKDKIEHFAISAAMTASTAFVLHNHFQVKRDNAIVFGFSVSLSLGGIKELIDKRTPGEQSSWKDLVADIIGCAAGAIVIRGAAK
jgi:uncharacterized protein YfiM (DUF2279 family)